MTDFAHQVSDYNDSWVGRALDKDEEQYFSLVLGSYVSVTDGEDCRGAKID
jgi:hypothetical protein